MCSDDRTDFGCVLRTVFGVCSDDGMVFGVCVLMTGLFSGCVFKTVFRACSEDGIRGMF